MRGVRYEMQAFAPPCHSSSSATPALVFQRDPRIHPGWLVSRDEDWPAGQARWAPFPSWLTYRIRVSLGGRVGRQPGTLVLMSSRSITEERHDLALLTDLGSALPPDCAKSLETAEVVGQLQKGDRHAPAWRILSRALAMDGQALLDAAVHAVHHRPGAGVSVGYTATVATSHGALPLYLVASTARLTRPHSAGHVTLDAPALGLRPGDPALPSQPVHVWKHPQDPELPALRPACTPSRMATILGGRVDIDMVTYRPTRRAVLRLTRFPAIPDAEPNVHPEQRPSDLIRPERLYAKVLRPSQTDAFLTRHHLLSDAGIPVPGLRYAEGEGLVILEEARGQALSHLLSRGMEPEESSEVFRNLLALLDAIPAAILDLPQRPAWSDRVLHYGHAAATALPERRREALSVARGVEEIMADIDPGPLVPTHGDFYEANLLMTGRSISSVLDLDSFGPGRRVDDLACLLGHMSVLDSLAPNSYPHIRPILRQWTELAEASLGISPAALRARCAGVVLSLVAGARREDGTSWHDDAERRLATAQLWLDGARAAR